MQNKMCQNARAIIKGGKDFPDICGEVLFSQRQNGVMVTAKISGFPGTESLFYGFHIHQGDSCTGEDFSETGGHYNPKNRPHPMHSGDLPPLISCAGKAYLQFITARFNLCEIIGKTVVIHGGSDDFRSQPSGDAGEKIACGLIYKV